MKRIILSEGRNDTIFLKELLTRKMDFEEDKIIFFDQNSQDNKKNQKNLEDKFFSKLETEWEGHRLLLLVKSEGGKDNIIAINESRFRYFCEKRHDPIILIDLDNKPMEIFIDKLDKKLTNTFKGINLTTKSCELETIDDATIHSMKLFKNNNHIGTIYLIGFYQSLEHVTGINDEHNDDQKKSISEEYIKKSQIHKIFRLAFNE